MPQNKVNDILMHGTLNSINGLALIYALRFMWMAASLDSITLIMKNSFTIMDGETP